jgi:triosephosphate isomerase (TIM)
MVRPTPLVAGNWKMNGLKMALTEVLAMRSALEAGENGRADVLICPPATVLSTFSNACLGSALALGGQDCHADVQGAHTGDISAEMLRDAGASYVIVGHSERRINHHETDAQVHAKAQAAKRAGLTAIVCVGETEDERRKGIALSVVARQIEASIPVDMTASDLVVAYEPVWAIGTGLTPTPADVTQVHAEIRKRLIEKLGLEGSLVRILYGGSVKPSNAAELLSVPHVDGALVGGASLKAADLFAIAAVYKA